MTRPFAALLVLSFLSLAPQALWAESEVYGGIGLGYSTFSVDTIDFEGSALATRQFLGLRYGEYVGLEVGYIDFGTVNDRIAVQPGPSVNNGIETWGYDLSLVGRYPVNEELAAFGKVGLIRWDSESTVEPFPLPTQLDGEDLIWGVGLDFRGSGPIHLRIEAELVDIEFADSWWVLTTSVMYGFQFGR